MSSDDVTSTLEQPLSKIASAGFEQNDEDSDGGPESVTLHMLTLWVEGHQY